MSVASPRQLYSPLDRATYAALRASIERFGVLIPIAVDHNGELLDGHHRSRIAAELGVECPAIAYPVSSEEEAESIVRTLNEDRRMLTPEQRRPIVSALREDGHSIRAIAGALGVSKGAVQNDLVSGVPVSTPDRVEGEDGKTYPATRPKMAGRPAGTKSVPLSLDTDRQRQIAKKAKERIERAVGTCNGIGRGFDDLNVEAALLAATEEEVAGWHEALREAKSAISRLQTKLKESR